jgi:hypothetical protein
MVHPMQPTGAAAVCDGPIAQADIAELPPRDDPVLARCQRRDRLVERVRCAFFRDSDQFPHQAPGDQFSSPRCGRKHRTPPQALASKP